MNDLMTADPHEHPGAAVTGAPSGSVGKAAAAGRGRVGRVLSLVRLHLLGLRGALRALLGLLLIVAPSASSPAISPRSADSSRGLPWSGAYQG